MSPRTKIKMIDVNTLLGYKSKLACGRILTLFSWFWCAELTREVFPCILVTLCIINCTQRTIQRLTTRQHIVQYLTAQWLVVQIGHGTLNYAKLQSCLVSLRMHAYKTLYTCLYTHTHTHTHTHTYELWTNNSFYLLRLSHKSAKF
jgi:hypothetical protein